ncbi:MAG: UbiA-like polyprenyltransferase [Pirellulaceae bacterium]
MGQVASAFSIESSTKRAWSRIREYGELVRFSHTIFALPFALLSTFWATFSVLPDKSSSPNYPVRWIAMLLCMVTARSFAMAFNRVADAKWDAANPRTAGRPIPAGKISRGAAARFTALCAIGFISSTALFFPNRWPLYLSIPVLVWLAGYSYAKRFTSAAHFWLGSALMLAPICAWIGLRGEWLAGHPSDLLAPSILGAAVFFWVSGFDLIYACQDAGFDRNAGLHSIPANWGIPVALQAAKWLHLGIWLLLALLPWAAPAIGLSWIWWGALGVIAGLLVYEHRIVRPEDLRRVDLAFFRLNGWISLILSVGGILDLFL